MTALPGDSRGAHTGEEDVLRLLQPGHETRAHACEADPSELHDLSGQPRVSEVERELRAALAEKMILDLDCPPLPAIQEAAAGQPGAKRKAGAALNRAAQSEIKDTDKDGS